MTPINRNIIRGLLVITFVVVNSFLIFGISSIFTYLNTGADRSKMLHTEIKKAESYIPKVNWSNVKNEGRQIDDQTLTDIENDYLNAWYVRHIAYKNNIKDGIKDYYTENARANFFSIIDVNKNENITIEATTLEHHPKLEFFSEDGQLAMITDHNVKEYKRIIKNEIIVQETEETSTYQVILLLEDGIWRIRHLVKTPAVEIDTITSNKIPLNHKIKGINYYPQATPWNTFGGDFNTDVITQDFRIIKDSGLNTIRIFIQYEDFGKATIKSAKLKKLESLLDLAESLSLKVIVTLFDFYGDYSILDWTLNQKHAETIVSTFKDHDAILAWDVKNEPDLDFESRGKDNVIAWAKNMIEFIKEIDQNHAVTIGWAKIKNATILKDEVDLVSFHYYENIENFEEVYLKLQQEILDKPSVLGEFGMSSYRGFWKPFGSSQKKQAEFYQKMQTIFKNNDIQSMSWTLYDFTEIPKEVVGRLPWRKNIQKKFGFIDKNGNHKDSFKYISKD